MKTISIPMGLVGDKTTTPLHVYVAATLSMEASAYGWVRMSQKAIANNVNASQEEVVEALRVMRDKSYISVESDDDGTFFRLLWFKTTKAEAPKRYRWVFVRRLGDDGKGGYLRINGGPDDRDELASWLVGQGYELIRLHESAQPKTPS